MDNLEDLIKYTLNIIDLEEVRRAKEARLNAQRELNERLERARLTRQIIDQRKTMKKYETLITPKGIATFTHLHAPDDEGQYADGKYKVTLLIPKDDPFAGAFTARVNTEHIEQRGKKKTDPPVHDGDEWADSAETDEAAEKRASARGHYRVTFKSKFQPQLVGQDKLPLPEGLEIRHGDVVKVACVVMPYDKGKNAGVSLGLRAVQLVEKRSGVDYSAYFDDESVAEDQDEDVPF